MTLSGLLKSAATDAARRAATLKDRVRPPERGVAILIYHRVGAATPMSVDLPLAQFTDQIAQIADRATTLDDALRELNTPAPPPPDPTSVVVTFDDGTADVLDLALPVLVEHQVPMVLYLATKFIEDQVWFPHDGRPTSWAALADGLSTGLLEIGSHTHGHALLDRLPANEVDDELDRSIGLIEERLGVTPVHFAYPKGLPGSPVADLAVRRRFESAAVGGTRTNPYLSVDPWNLKRTPVQVRDDARAFTAKVEGGLSFEDDLRSVVNRVRYRGVSS